MFNHRREAECSLTAPLPGPRFIAWWVWTAISSGALIAALWWAGGSQPAWREEGYVGLVGFMGRVFGGLGTVFRTGDQGASLGARAAFLAALLLLLYVWWRATRAWLAFRPGPVDVQQLEDATRPGTVKPSDTDLTAKLRRCLSESSMYPPTTLPAQAPVEGFLELLGDVELDPHKLGSGLPKVLSRLRPKLAYRVSGILQSRDAVPDRYGMTITVTAFLFGGSRAMTVWGRDWDEVIGKASIWIVSTLLPVTRAGRVPPWGRWWGRELRPELYQAYQEATEFSRAGRHHEALEQYFKAVQLDPTNPCLRAELAETQEKMGLHVDALNTAQRALTLDGQTARAYQKRLWQSRWNPHWRRFRYLRHPRRYREVLGLRYRNSIILGTAEVTAHQWYMREGAQSKKIHDELIPILVERYWPTAVGLDGTRVDGKAPEEAKSALRTILEKKHKKRCGAHDNHHSEEERTIRLVFQRASLQETNRLASDDMWARLLLYWPAALWSWTRFFWPAAYVQTFRGAQQAITRGAFLTNREVWAPLRLAWASWKYNPQEHPYKWRQRYAWRWRSRISWNDLDIRFLERRLTWARRWPAFHQDWLAHYNAACVCAIGMHTGSHSEEERTEQSKDFARHAIDHLEEAVLTPRGSFAMVERAWMTEEDIDLRALWKEPEMFRDFIRTAYPSPEFPLRPPAPNFADSQLREYDYRLLESVAKVMEQVWQARSEKVGVDIHTAASWLRAENKAWSSVHEIVDVNRKYNWQDRVDLIHQIQTDCHAASTCTPGFPPKMGLDEDSTADQPNHQRIAQRLKDLERYVETGTTREDVDLETPSWSDTPYANSQAGQRVLRDAAADGLTWLNAKAVRKIAVRYAATWQRLSDWLELSESQKPFSQAVGKVPQLTRRSLSQKDNRKLSI